MVTPSSSSRRKEGKGAMVLASLLLSGVEWGGLGEWSGWVGPWSHSHLPSRRGVEVKVASVCVCVCVAVCLSVCLPACLPGLE